MLYTHDFSLSLSLSLSLSQNAYIFIFCFVSYEYITCTNRYRMLLFRKDKTETEWKAAYGCVDYCFSPSSSLFSSTSFFLPLCRALLFCFFKLNIAVSITLNNVSKQTTWTAYCPEKFVYRATVSYTLLIISRQREWERNAVCVSTWPACMLYICVCVCVCVQ